MQKARRHCLSAAPTACKRTVSGTISLLCSRSFSPFPHGTCSLSVSYAIFSLTGWARLFHAEFHVLRATLDYTRLPETSSTGLSPSMAQLSNMLLLAPFLPYRVPNPILASTTMVWALPPSLATTKGIIIYFLFLRVLRCFSSPRSLTSSKV